jgi:CelD/BcsL family acetyltransferase involved in cellulose biosynthesis
MRITLIHPRELGAADIQAWRGHQAADPSFASPFLTPEWAALLGETRPEAARIAVIEGGRGYLPVQRLSRFSAMGLGAPIADYQGLVGEPGLEIDAGELCRTLKVGRIDLAHVPERNPILTGRAENSEGAWIVDVAGGAEAYRNRLKARRNDFISQQGKKERKLARERGEPVFTAGDRSGAAFETMLNWKLAQLKRAGQPAIWAKPWVRDTLERSFVTQDPAFSGVLFTLSIGEKLIAANYFLRSGDVLHDWIMAHHAAFNIYSPGVILGRMAVEWAADNGFREVNFGPGDYPYKRQLSTGQRMLAWGSVAGRSLSGAVRSAEYGLREQIERMPNPRLAALPGKAMRKLDLMRGLAA